MIFDGEKSRFLILWGLLYETDWHWMNLPTQKLSVCVCSASFGHGRNSAKNLASTWAIWDWAQVVATVSRLRSDRCLTTVGKGGAAAAVEHSGASFWQFRWFFRILRMFSLLPAFPRGTSMTIKLRFSNYGSATTAQQLRLSNHGSATTAQQPRLSNHGSATTAQQPN